MTLRKQQCFRSSRAFIGVGSNVGDRMGYITRAAQCIIECEGVRALEIAPIYETRPVGPAGPGNFLNTVFRLEVCLSPVQLLHALHDIEIALGRSLPPAASRIGSRQGSRTIDLDILFFDDLVFQNDELTVPHPYLQQREFVLRPLCDLAPDLTHPELGTMVRDLLAALPPSDQVLGMISGGQMLAHA